VPGYETEFAHAVVLMVSVVSEISKTEQQQHQPDSPLTPEEFAEFKPLVEELEIRSGRRMLNWARPMCKRAFRDYQPRWRELHGEALDKEVRDPVAFFVQAIRAQDHLTEPLTCAATPDDSALGEQPSEEAESADEAVAELIRDSLLSAESAKRLMEVGAPWHQLEGISRFRVISEQLAGADKQTAITLAKAAQGLPEAAIHNAFESLNARRLKQPPLVSEARYFVSALNTIRAERTYG
jgi:hypothetical protein